MLILDPRSTALVLIDLQNGIIGTPLAPRSGRDVLATATAFARRFRAAGRLLCLSTSPWRMITRTRSANLWISPHRSQQADCQRAGATWAAASQSGDIGITKRQWGAF